MAKKRKAVKKARRPLTQSQMLMLRGKRTKTVKRNPRKRQHKAAKSFYVQYQNGSGQWRDIALFYNYKSAVNYATGLKKANVNATLRVYTK